MSLAAKHQRFVEEYLKDLNGAQAAIRAGYSAKTAKEQASRLLTNANVLEALSEAQERRSKKTGIDAEWVLTRLAHESLADVADLYDENGGLKSVHDWPLIWRQGLVAGMDVEEIRENGAVVGVVRKVKLSDRIKRIELIGRHIDVQAFKDKIEQIGTMTLVVSPEDAGL